MGKHLAWCHWLKKLKTPKPKALLKKELHCRCFSMNFGNFSQHLFYRTSVNCPFDQNDVNDIFQMFYESANKTCLQSREWTQCSVLILFQVIIVISRLKQNYDVTRTFFTLRECDFCSIFFLEIIAQSNRIKNVRELSSLTFLVGFNFTFDSNDKAHC